MELAKKAYAWLLGQSTLDGDVAAPGRYELETEARTSEKYLVVLRAAYTVGPEIGDEEGHPLLLHQPLLDVHAKTPDAGRVEKLVRRHVRALAAGMTASQMLTKGHRSFMKEVLDRVQPDLAKQLGLRVCSAAVEMLEVHVPTYALPEEVVKKLEAVDADMAAVDRALELQVASEKVLVAELRELVERVRADTSRTKEDAESDVDSLTESIQALTVRIDGGDTRAATRKVLLVAGAHKVAPLEVQEAGMAAPAEGNGELPTDGNAHAN
ncbi:hypothetical protein EJB05_32360 [Eragrostis curvula]|uniref:Band 7 domain-containing protein n=1 Tax=Eragrostis curvula TaxID=38414 RepID=A0A5J9UGL0_9POAL|nr:hypothetical protein EJB05_32360 [Eragrostis curvula]